MKYHKNIASICGKWGVIINETDLQKNIGIELSKYMYTVFRCNVGKVRLNDGRFFDTGLPKGHTDLVAYKNGKTYFVEVKVGKNKPSKEQINFINRMKEQGFVAGVVYSVEEALELVGENSDNRRL